MLRRLFRRIPIEYVEPKGERFPFSDAWLRRYRSNKKKARRVGKLLMIAVIALLVGGCILGAMAMKSVKVKSKGAVPITYEMPYV